MCPRAVPQVESKALSPDTAGEPPHPRAAAVARELGLRLRPGKVAAPFDEVTDIVNFDLVVVMDRFDLEAVLREVAVYDALNPGGCYSARVRRIGDWAPPPRAGVASAASFEASRSLRGDVVDPLYGAAPCYQTPAVRRADMRTLTACRESGRRARNGSHLGCCALDPSWLPWAVEGAHASRAVRGHLMRFDVCQSAGQPAVGFEPFGAASLPCASC